MGKILPCIMDNINISEIQTALESKEKLIKITKETRDAALNAKNQSEARLNLSKEELTKLGVTPENAAEEAERLAREIISDLEKIDSNIPYDLLRKLKRI